MRAQEKAESLALVMQERVSLAKDILAAKLVKHNLMINFKKGGNHRIVM